MGFVTDTVSLVMDAVDDPETVGKFTPAKIIGWLENSFSLIVPTVFGGASGPNSVRWDLTIMSAQADYAKPPHVLEIFGAHRLSPHKEIINTLRPRSVHNPFGPGLLIEKNRISIIPDPHVNETYRIWYIPSGDVKLAEGLVKTGSTASAVKLETATTGVLDGRANAYAGYVLSLTGSNGQIEERMVNTSTFDGTDHACSVTPEFTITVDTTTSYDLRPLIGKLIQTAVVLDTALYLLAFQEESKRSALIEKRQKQVMWRLKMNAANEEQIVGGHFAADTQDNERYTGGHEDFLI